jgi:hypothetical protein
VLGANVQIMPERPDRDTQGRTLGTSTPLDPIWVRFQPERIEDEITKVGQVKLSIMTAPYDANLAERDIFTAQGRTWRVHTLVRIAGLGKYMRAIVTSEKQ